MAARVALTLVTYAAECLRNQTGAPLSMELGVADPTTMPRPITFRYATTCIDCVRGTLARVGAQFILRGGLPLLGIKGAAGNNQAGMKKANMRAKCSMWLIDCHFHRDRRHASSKNR